MRLFAYENMRRKKNTINKNDGWFYIYRSINITKRRGETIMKSKGNKMTQILAVCLSTVMLCGILMPAATAKAATEIKVNPTGKITGTEVEGSELVYDATKNDTTNPYFISLQGEMDMSAVWSGFTTFRGWYFAIPGDRETYWGERRITGEWNISAKIDTTYATVNQAEVTPANVQAMFEASNPGTTFVDLMKCTATSYDPATGIFSATFGIVPGTSPAMLDAAEARPAKLVFSTPSEAVYVKQADFSVGDSIELSDLKVDGWLDIDVATDPFNSLPINFATETKGSDSAKMVKPAAGALEIVDNQGQTTDGIITVYPYIDGATQALQLEKDGTPLTAAQIADVTWEVEGIAGFAGKGTIGTIANGTNEFKAVKSGIVRVTATYQGATASIDIVAPGDANRDGSLDNSDASGIFSAGLSGMSILPAHLNDKYTLYLLDINRDGDIDSADASAAYGLAMGTSLYVRP